MSAAKARPAHLGVELLRRQRQPGLDVPAPLVGEDLGRARLDTVERRVGQVRRRELGHGPARGHVGVGETEVHRRHERALLGEFETDAVGHGP
ncbi:hypothetical protein PV396_27470 [Streptomyces sp. ME02-8801-2C]|nr:hypothetical protein [Streptomyces sp. ME02-8801-2C]